jgi:hypothetical protein
MFAPAPGDSSPGEKCATENTNRALKIAAGDLFMEYKSGGVITDRFFAWRGPAGAARGARRTAWTSVTGDLPNGV